MKEELLTLITAMNFDQALIKKVKSLNFKKAFKDNPYTNLKLIQDASDDQRFILSLHALVFANISYQKRGIPFYLFKESMLDFNRRALRYHDKYGSWGIASSDIKWLNLLFNLKIFKLHTLRFQIFPMDYQEMEREGEDQLLLKNEIKARFPQGHPLLNIHIEDDTDLSPQAIDKSFILAQSFFHEFFPDFTPQGLITRTWLIHPSLKDVLSKDSNILKFAARFEIIGLSFHYKQALERIYGTSDLKIIQALDKKSSLQKEAYKHYQNLGVGIGYHPLKGEYNDPSSLHTLIRQ